jgi:hypothetical protein
VPRKVHERWSHVVACARRNAEPNSKKRCVGSLVSDCDKARYRAKCIRLSGASGLLHVRRRTQGLSLRCFRTSAVKTRANSCRADFVHFMTVAKPW